ncbi:MAG TPA: DinB family protein, partial [Longimicrobium sp.]
MVTIEELVRELHQEAGATRRVLERIPEDQLEWRPHPKSMAMGQLALHVASLPTGIVEISTWPKFDIMMEHPRPAPATLGEVLETLDRGVADAAASLSRMDDAELAQPWRMVRGDDEVMTIPRGALFRAVLFNHWYHHR